MFPLRYGASFCSALGSRVSASCGAAAEASEKEAETSFGVDRVGIDWTLFCAVETRNACNCPFNMPVPAICPAALIAAPSQDPSAARGDHAMMQKAWL